MNPRININIESRRVWKKARFFNACDSFCCSCIFWFDETKNLFFQVRNQNFLEFVFSILWWLFQNLALGIGIGFILDWKSHGTTVDHLKILLWLWLLQNSFENLWRWINKYTPEFDERNRFLTISILINDRQRTYLFIQEI